MSTKPKRKVILSDSEDSDVFENQKSSESSDDEDSVVSEGSEDDLNDDGEEEMKTTKKRDRSLSDVSESSTSNKVKKVVPAKSPPATKKETISAPNVSRKTASSPSSKVVKAGFTNHSKSSSSTSSLSTTSNKMSIESATDLTRGPPVTSDSGAKKLLLQYLQQQNRPYSSIQVTDNLHGRIQKSVVERLLKSFAETPGSGIIEKVYGKAKIYYPDQSHIADVKAGEIERIEKEIERSKLDLSQLVSNQKNISLELAKLQKEPTDNNLDKVLAELEAEVSGKQARVDKISSASLDPEALENTIKKHNYFRTLWKVRKEMCMEPLDMISDSMSKKIKVVMNEIGIETDEDNNAVIPQIIVNNHNKK